MRTAAQILDTLLGFARQREDVRAVVMNGSRVNPNAVQDIFMDYDVVFYVRQPRLFLQDQSWMARFGERVIVQQNDCADHGNLGHIVKPPTRKEFDEVTNEILWCAANVAKGLWRDELAYTHAMLDVVVRDAMLKLLAWYAASRHAWQVNTGKFGKWLPKYLPPDFWLRYTRTYAGPDADETWTALLLLVELAGEAGDAAAQALDYAYPHEDHRRTLAYLNRVRALRQEKSYG